MNIMNQNLDFNNEEWKNITNLLKEIQPDLLRDFITYWSTRKLDPATTNNLLKEIRTSNSDLWLNLIESNQKFRNLYGEEKANEVIKIIEKKFLKESVRH